MAEQFVGKISEFKDGDRRIVFMGEREIGVFRHEGEFYAYSNVCLHQGGPACEGLTETEMHFVCPWHGMEYDLKTGECVGDRKQKLRKYNVVQKGDDVYVVS
jgi:nitrite reductase/ring-hydroxylating ferredoxin subunit